METTTRAKANYLATVYLLSLFINNGASLEDRSGTGLAVQIIYDLGVDYHRPDLLPLTQHVFSTMRGASSERSPQGWLGPGDRD